MYNNALNIFWQIPSVQKMVNNIKEDILTGKSVIIFHPYLYDADKFAQAIYHELYSIDNMKIHFQDIIVSEYQPNSLYDMAEFIGLDIPRTGVVKTPPWQLENFPDITLITGIHKLESNKQKQWARLIKEWADTMVSIRGEGGNVRMLCVIEPAYNLIQNFPQQDTTLSWKWWWGFPSVPELRLASREAFDNNEMEIAWLEAVVSGIAAGDIILASDIIEASPKSLDEIIKILNQHSPYLDDIVILPDKLGTYFIPPPSNQIIPVPKSLWHHWGQGMVVASYDYGIEWHPSVLLKFQDISQIKLRIWRGQAGILMPLIDNIRRKACSILVKQVNEKWYDRWFPPDNAEDLQRLRDNPLDGELGYILKLANKENVFEDNYWKHVLYITWKTRNDLAHYEMIDWQTFKDFWAIRNY
jgi:hypothetical protein